MAPSSEGAFYTKEKIVEEFRKEIMCHTPLKEHLEEHEGINKMFNVDCDNVSVEEHLNYHLEYKYKIGKITKEQYNRYKA